MTKAATKERKRKVLSEDNRGMTRQRFQFHLAKRNQHFASVPAGSWVKSGYSLCCNLLLKWNWRRSFRRDRACLSPSRRLYRAGSVRCEAQNKKGRFESC